MLYDNRTNSSDVALLLKYSQQNSGAGNFETQSDTEEYSRVKLGKNNLANELANSASCKTILPALYGLEANALLREKKSEAALRRSQEELRQLSIQLLNIQENERQRIAADLHDGIGQSLSLIKLSLESVTQRINSGDCTQALELLQHLNRKVKETMAELHQTTMDMRPSMLDDLGIIPTLSWFFREFEIAWQGGQIKKNICIVERDITLPLKTTIFRILQEAMNNIVKHACADLIVVSLMKSGELLQLSIEDNGIGFDLDKVSMRCGSGNCGLACGFGLLTMKERARSTNGKFEMQSNFEKGTKILISWPYVESTIN